MKQGRPINLCGPLGSLAQKLGGVDKLANEMGVSSRSLQYWAKGERRMSGLALKLFERLAESSGISTKGLKNG